MAGWRAHLGGSHEQCNRQRVEGHRASELDRSLPKLVMQSENLSHLLYLVMSPLTARSYLALFLSLKLPNFNCVKRRSRALWRVVRMHVVLRSVAGGGSSCRLGALASKPSCARQSGSLRQSAPTRGFGNAPHRRFPFAKSPAHLSTLLRLLSRARRPMSPFRPRPRSCATTQPLNQRVMDDGLALRRARRPAHPQADLGLQAQTRWHGESAALRAGQHARVGYRLRPGVLCGAAVLVGSRLLASTP